MDATSIAQMRLINQKLVKTDLTSPVDVVSWMGAIQAQDYTMSRWAVGSRLKTSTDRLITEAVDNGAIIRTHILRPTWHLVTADDIRWMMPLSGPRVRVATRASDKFYGFTDEIVTRNNKTVAAIIEKKGSLTRPQIEAEFNKLGIKTDYFNFMAYVMMCAELDGVVCSGRGDGAKQTYCLFEERVGKLTPLPEDEALEKLARKYFTSHAPATLQDFMWWSGLSTTQARLGMKLIKSDFEVVVADGGEYWVNRSFNGSLEHDSDIHLLPAFDEFIVSYRERRHIFENTDYSKIITRNGIFKPAITCGGKVLGLWKRLKKKEAIAVETELFSKVNKKDQQNIDRALEAYKLFNFVAKP